MLIKAGELFKYDIKKEIGKYVGTVKDRYDRFDFEKLMLKKYNAIKLSSKEEVKQYYLKHLGKILDQDDDIYTYSEENITSEHYDVYIIEDESILDQYFVCQSNGKKETFFEQYIEYDDDNNVVSAYCRGDFNPIFLEIQYFFEKQRRAPMKDITLNI